MLLLNPSALPGSASLGRSLLFLVAAGSQSLTVAVGYIPNANGSAFTILDAGQTFGPYPATVSVNATGAYELTATLNTQLAAGPVWVQPGLLAGGVFSVIGSPIPGLLSIGATAGAALDWDASLDGPFVDIAGQSSVLNTDGVEFVHIRWNVSDVAGGGSIVLTGNANVVSAEMAIVYGEPSEGDWRSAMLITRAVGDDTDGEYSEIRVGAGQALTLSVGTWHVYGRLTTTGETIVECAPGFLTIDG